MDIFMVTLVTGKKMLLRAGDIRWVKEVDANYCEISLYPLHGMDIIFVATDDIQDIYDWMTDV
jgi:hypothetical protein